MMQPLKKVLALTILPFLLLLELTPLVRNSVLAFFGGVLILIFAPQLIVFAVFLFLVIFIQFLNMAIEPISYLGIELGYFFTFMSGYLFGPMSGFWFGVLFLIAHLVQQLQWESNPFDLLFKIFGIPGLGYLAGLVSGINVVFAGTTAVVGIAIAIFIINMLSSFESDLTVFFWCVGLVFFNFILFKSLAPVMTGLLG